MVLFQTAFHCSLAAGFLFAFAVVAMPGSAALERRIHETGVWALEQRSRDLRTRSGTPGRGAAKITASDNAALITAWYKDQ
jgi:hypothetical protein